jgi:hypothetical protein
MCPHIAKLATIAEASRISQANGGAPGGDGLTLEAVEASGRQQFPQEISSALLQNSYELRSPRQVEIPKGNGACLPGGPWAHRRAPCRYAL